MEREESQGARSDKNEIDQREMREKMSSEKEKGRGRRVEAKKE